MTQVDFYDKEQIDDMEIGTPDDAASSSGSLWARIKNALARIISLETADTNNVKKTGTSTVTGTLEVPTIPPTATSAINSVYANDATEGVNNILHKTGTEYISGTKVYQTPPYLQNVELRQLTEQDYQPPEVDTDVTLWLLNNRASNRQLIRIYVKYNTDGSAALMCRTLNKYNTTYVETKIADLRT